MPYEYNPFLKTDKHGQNKGIQRVPVGQATYTIYKQGNTIIAEPSPETGKKKYAGTDASTVIQAVVDSNLAATELRIVVKDSMNLSSAVTLKAVGTQLIFTSNMTASGNAVIMQSALCTVEFMFLTGSNTGTGTDVQNDSCRVKGLLLQGFSTGVLLSGSVSRAYYTDIDVNRIITCGIGIKFINANQSWVKASVIGSMTNEGILFDPAGAGDQCGENRITVGSISGATIGVHFSASTNFQEGNMIQGSIYVCSVTGIQLDALGDHYWTLFQGAIDNGASTGSDIIDHGRGNLYLCTFVRPASVNIDVATESVMINNYNRSTQRYGDGCLETVGVAVYHRADGTPAIYFRDTLAGANTGWFTMSGGSMFFACNTGRINLSTVNGASTGLGVDTDGYAFAPKVLFGAYGAGWAAPPAMPTAYSGKFFFAQNTSDGTARIYFYINGAWQFK